MPTLDDNLALQSGIALSGGGSASEQALAKIWTEVLRLPSVEVDANFFDIGGDSMKAMEVIVRVGEMLRIELPLMAFFEDPTIAHLAAVVDELTGGAAVVPIVRVSGRRKFPLSYSQQVFWLLEQQNAGMGIYNTARIFRVRGKLDASLLERSLNELRRRHEILQVRFVQEADGPVQMVDPGTPLQMDVADLSDLDPAASQQEAQKLALATVREPFNLESGPPLRARLVRLTDDDSLLCIAIHHVVSDGFTGSILLDELSAIYDAFAEGMPNPLPELQLHFTDYAAWERVTMDEPRIQKDLEYWRPVLEGAPTSVDLPPDFEQSSEPHRRGRLRSITMPVESLQRLQALAGSNGATLFTVLVAGFRILLYRWSGQADFIIGTIASNRSRSETERMIGCFVNPLPIRNPITEGQTTINLLNREKTAVMNAFAHQDCPFPKIVEAINPERTSNDNPLFNVALLLQSFPTIAVNGRRFQAESVNFDAEVGLLDLRFIASETSAGLHVDCEYSTAHFEDGTVDKLLAAYLDVLTQMVASPETAAVQIEIPEDLAQRGAEHRRAQHRQTIAITANFTAEPLEEPLAFWMKELRISSRIQFAPFDQIFQQLLDPGSLIATNSDGFNIVFIQWREGRPSGEQARELAEALKTAATRSTAPIIVCVCPPAASAEEQVLAAELAGHTGVHIIYPREILDLYPVENYRDEYADAIGAIPYTQDFFVALASMVARTIHGIGSIPFKVIALDCDNTLWNGVCGEEGPLGVEIDAPRRALQEFMLTQRDAGMLLCLCSKNAEADVAAVFETNPGMLLRSEHIVASRINWKSKSENLKDLALALKLGVDSFVFIDDNPLECAEVRANCPGAMVLELPADAAKIPDMLRHIWAFDHTNVTQEDRQRSERYRQEQEREQSRSTAGDLDQFLQGLDLKIEIRSMQPDDIARVSQLTQRTNQFNCATIRRSEAEIAAAVGDGVECRVVEVSDRFGKYGLVGVALFAAQPDALSVGTLLMSCRALGRKVEHHILAHLGQIALDRGLKRVDVMFIPSEKNRPALDFLDSVGSEFRAADSDAAVYRFPAAHASMAHELAVSAVEQPQGSKPAPAAAIRTRRTDLTRIASELSNVKDIVRAIQLLPGNTAVETGSLKARSAPEEILAGIWATLLRTSAPGIHDDFFRLGGNSLLAVQVISRVRQSLGVEMPLRAIFEEPTLAGFAQRIETVRRAKTSSVKPPLISISRSGPVPASFAQQRLWFMDLFEPGNPLYNIPQMYRLRGELQPEALEAAINEIVRRHEALRTTFQTLDGQPVQIISPNLKISLEVVTLTGLFPEEREEALQRLANERALQPFDLANGPLLRATLVKLYDLEQVLLLTLHHIVGDGWSGSLLATELVTLYEAFSQGRTSPLPELTLQYADFAVWQRGWLQGDALDTQVSYWSKQLAGAPALLELPTDRPRPAVLRHRGAVCTRVFSLEFLNQLRGLSQAEGVTLFMTLLAGFQLLLARYSGQDDIVVGSPVAGRDYTEIEPIIGFFVNTLALRTHVAGEISFRELLGRVRQVALDAFAQQEIPFERLVEELKPERSLSYNPIFQVLLGLQKFPNLKFALAEIEIERTSVHQSTSLFDLSWSAFEAPDGLLVRMEYDTDLFDESTICRIADHFETLMESAVRHPESPIAELALMSKEERNQVVVEFNATSAALPKDLCLHDFVARQASRTPDSVALICGEESLSYADLNSRANRLAHYLIQRGAGPDVLIGIHAERSPEMLIGILGILKSGSAYVPLDPKYPKQRLSDILQDSHAPVLLTQKAIADELSEFEGERIYLDADWDTISRESSEDPKTAVRACHLAYVLFTSGSTGRPKGVAIEHHSAATFVQWAQHVFTPAELSGVLLSTSMCFDLSIFEIFVPLSVGGKIILAENALYLPTLPAKDEVTLINTVPSAMAELVRMAGVPDSVQTVNLAGEALPEVLVEQIYAHTNTQRLYNLYGPTEDTTYSTFTLVKRGTPVTVGRPITDTQAYILDARLNPVPIGVPGELYLAGEGLARGYYGRPDLTAERFVPNPFTAEPEARMYRTSDLTRFLPNGEIEYLGRMDHQVKIRGFRIELGEIENALDSHPGVQQSIVIAREDAPGDKRLVAYVVATQETPDSNKSQSAELVPQLRRWLEEKLPEFMIPSAFVLLDSMPLSPNGKTNRSALPAPEQSQDGSATYVAPRTPLEEILAAIWSEVLHLPIIGVNDDFFSLGGHSLLATQVISRIRRSLAVEMPLRAIFEEPTLAGLAQRIETVRRAKIASVKPPLISIPRSGPVPASFAQQRLWFMDLFEPGNPLYNIPQMYRLRGELQPEALEAAINEIVRRHEALRTTFQNLDGQPVQIISPNLKISLEVETLTGLFPEEQEEALQRLANERALQPFYLAHGPLLRATLIKLHDREQVLLLILHHIVGDGWSSSLLATELVTLYEAFSQGRTSPLPELTLQYADFAVWQRGWLQGEALDTQVSYWSKQLAGAPALLELPTDRPRPAVLRHRGAVYPHVFPLEFLNKLKAVSRAEGVTFFMTLLAGFQLMLSRHSAQEDIVVGSPVAGRDYTEIEPLIGFFVNTLALRTHIPGDITFRELLGRVRQVALDAFAQQEIPFERLVEELKPQRSLSYNPIFQVFLGLQKSPNLTFELADIKIQRTPVHQSTSVFDLSWFAFEAPDGLLVRMEYDTDLFDEATIRRFAGHFETLMESAVSQPESPVSKLSLLGDEETNQVVSEWNDTASAYARDLCLPALIEVQVAKHPDRVAAVFQNRSFTYRELNQRANQLAHHLQSIGVGPETLVGVCLERSLDMLVAILGVLKAGGAYLPLDPSFPKDRQAFMLEDARVPVLLTSSQLSPNIPPHAAIQVCLDTDWDSIATHSTENPLSLSTAENLAYVLYTSGSTGKPKGVMITHRNLLNFLESMRIEPGLNETDKLVAVTTLSFDIAGLELWLPLYVGAQVIIATREVAMDGEQLAALLDASQATIMQATPATWRLLLESDWKGKPDLVVLCGGEALSPSLVSGILPLCKSMWNMYGPTETTIWSTICRVQPDQTISLGQPIANTQILILDTNNQLAPIGVNGELCIGGDGLSRGYLNRPELTAERFFPNPFALQPDARLYRTGDLARRLPNGTIQYVGRADFQVKIRGFRIELGEIEALLAAHPSVQECVVLAREDATGDKRLVAYIVTGPDHRESESESESKSDDQQADELIPQLRRTLGQKLPEYMIPSAFVLLDFMPLSPNGKINRHMLPAPDQSQEHSTTYAAPRTPLEEILAAIWSEVLHLPRIGVNDDFFSLGGHSLLATQVISRIRRSLAVEMPLRAIFEATKIAELAQRIDELKGDSPMVMPPLRRASRNEALPLSFAQQRLWFLDQFEPKSPLYNIPRAIRLAGGLNIAALETALNGIVERHEILRTTYRSTDDGHPFQVIAPQLHLPLPVIDLSDMPATDREKEGRRIAQAEASIPFNLATDPITRNLLVKMDERDHILLMVTHHIASDGWSTGILLRELTALYETALSGKPSSLPEMSVQYVDFAVWQRNWLQGEVLEQQLAYWRSRLEGAPPLLVIPTDRPRPATPTFGGEIHHFLLPAALADGIRALSRQHSATSFMTMLAAFQTLILHYTRQPDIVLGTDLANRTNVQTESLIGDFVNLLALRTDLSGDPSFEELLGRVREVAFGAYAHQDVPFDKLVEELQPERSRSHNPVVQVLFVQQNTPRTALTMPGVEITPYMLDVPSKFDMVVFVSETDKGIAGTWVYNPDLFDATTIARMASLYRLVLEQATANPALKLSDLMQSLREAEQQERVSQHKEFQEIGLQKLKSIKRRAIARE